jgi:hypothetical protein
MYEWKPSEESRQEQVDLEKRLSAYYGPALRGQPLPASSWLRLRSKLGSQSASSRRWRVPRLHIPRRPRRRSPPAYVSTAFARIVQEARLPYTVTLLSCRYRARGHVPSVRVTLFARRNIRLTLPSNLGQFVGSSELEVLLATGLARYFYVRRPAYVLLHGLVAAVVLLACVALVLFLKSGMPYMAFPLAAGVCAIVLGFSYVKGRRLSFRADNLMVQWLGRSAVCQGLHALADRELGHYRVRWGEPSLTERISRICGTRVAVEDEHLTLVR